MNEDAYRVHFESLSDSKLNKSIEELIDRPQLERLTKAAVHEWSRRHPGTIAPFLHERAIDRGGFPSCYSGPTKTVTLDED